MRTTSAILNSNRVIGEFELKMYKKGLNVDPNRIVPKNGT